MFPCVPSFRGAPTRRLFDCPSSPPETWVRRTEVVWTKIGNRYDEECVDPTGGERLGKFVQDNKNALLWRVFKGRKVITFSKTQYEKSR